MQNRVKIVSACPTQLERYSFAFKDIQGHEKYTTCIYDTALGGPPQTYCTPPCGGGGGGGGGISSSNNDSMIVVEVEVVVEVQVSSSSNDTSSTSTTE